ncbi:MAG: isocitrate/isopropylmalate dehydrogenase family protein [Spirochaetales bacterium]
MEKLQKGKYVIAVIRGDGIGPEVMEEGIKVLKAAISKRKEPELIFKEAPAGAECFLQTGNHFPEESFRICAEADAIFLGATGLPHVKLSDGTGISISWDLKQRLGLYAAIRPITLMSPGLSPLKDRKPGSIKFTIVRENSEGIYASRNAAVSLHDSVVVNPMVITRHASERIAHVAFRLCERGSGSPLDGVKRVTCVDKSNVLAGFALFRKVFDEVGELYNSIEKDHCFIDAAALKMVLQPDWFDILLTENMHGDILSDLGAALVGGLGFAPSGNVGDHYGMFEPAHGTAPSIAGKSIANPIATILSGAMMLKWLAAQHADQRLSAVADLLEDATSTVLSQGVVRTKDMGGDASTKQMGDAIAETIEKEG